MGKTSSVGMSGQVAVRAATLVELLRWRALNQPDRRAYSFLIDGVAQEQHLSYAELDRQARAIAAWLQRIGAGGERAVLLFQPGLHYIAAFFGCLYAGVIAVPAYPPRPNRSLERLQAIVEDGDIALALTTSDIRQSVEGQARATQVPELAGLRWLTTDDLALDLAESWQEPEIDGDSLAFLQYTSGSTSRPKGVMLTHGNLLANMVALQQAYGYTPDTRGLIWLPPYHDMGLIGGILQPCFVGFPVILMAPVTFLQRPFTWLSAIARYGIDRSAAPNFAYDLCARKITAEQRDTLDLSRWTMTITGAEPVRAETIRRFVDAFGPCGVREELFRASYGLAESTLIVSSGEPGIAPRTLAVVERELQQHRVVEAGPEEAARARILVSCGRAVADHQVRIVDPERLVECEPDVVGEIWVAGPSVAQGYWGQPEEIERTFRARLAGSAEGPFLRTGDFGFLRDGELYVTGRLKDLIIIDGRNHYPQDIELTVEGSHPVIRPNGVAAFAVELGDEERLVVVAEAERRYLSMLRELKNVASDNGRALDHADPVKRAIRRAVSEEHDLRVHAIELVRPGGVPKTSSGKIRRSACRNGFLAGTLDRWDS